MPTKHFNELTEQQSKTRTRRTKDEHGYEDIWTDLILILEMDAESREIEAAADRASNPDIKFRDATKGRW